MKSFRIIPVFVLFLGLVCPLAMSQGGDPVGLFEAAAAGRVTIVEINGIAGSTGDTIKLRVKRAVPETVNVRVMPGTVFRSGNSQVQDMVGSRVKGWMVNEFSYRPTEVIELTSDASADYLVEAFCMDIQKKNPGPSSRFSLGEIDGDAAHILTIGMEEDFSINAIQAALWIHRDGATDQILKRRFPVNDDQLQNAHQLLADFNATRTPPPAPPEVIEPDPEPGSVQDTVQTEPTEPSTVTAIPEPLKTTQPVAPPPQPVKSVPPDTEPATKTVDPKSEEDEAEQLPEFYRAAMRADWKTMELLMAQNREQVNVPISVGAKNGWTALHFAVDAGNFETASVLIHHGALVEARDSLGRTPLHLAARGCHQQLAVLLAAMGADVNATTNTGWTPLKYSEKNDCAAVRDVLTTTGWE